MVKKKKTNKKGRRRLLTFGVCSLIAIVLLSFTIGQCWIEIFDKYQEKKKLETNLNKLEKKEKDLKVDVKKLQDDDYIARYAREKYYFSKDGEFIIKIPEDKN